MSFDLAAFGAGIGLWPGVYLLAGGCAKTLSRPRRRDTVLTRVLPRQVPVLAVWRTIATVELGIGALVVSGVAAPIPEYAAAAALAVAALVAGWGVRHAPDAGCGCFGAHSAAPVSTSTVVRSGLLSAFALSSALVGQGWNRVLAHRSAALACLAVGVGLWAATPELRELARRLGLLRSAYSGIGERLRDAACARRKVSVERMVAQLRASTLWDEARGFLSQEVPSEHWQDGCRAYLCYPASYEGDAATAVFTLDIGAGGGASGVALVDEDNQQVFATIAGGHPPGSREVVSRLRSAYAGTVRRLRDAGCARRKVSVERMVAQLRASTLWDEAQGFLSQEVPSEHWQEGCRAYLCYPASYEGEAATAVFALDIGAGGGASGVALVDEDNQQVFATIAGERGRWWAARLRLQRR